MRLIKQSTLRTYWVEHADAKPSLLAFLLNVTNANWSSIQDVRKTYTHADAVTLRSGSVVTVFNIKGGRYRLIVAIHYNTGKVFVRDFLTHAQYDQQRWKTRH